MKVFLLGFVILGVLSLLSPSAADDVLDTVESVALAVDGPYEIENEGGLIGFVVARNEQLSSVTFKPCIGDAFEVSNSRLQETQLDCSDSPVSDENPLMVSCRSGPPAAASEAYANATRTDGPPGTLVKLSGGLDDVRTKELRKLSELEIVESVNAVKYFVDCGPYIEGLNKDGEPLSIFVFSGDPGTMRFRE